MSAKRKLELHALTPFQVRSRNYLRRVLPFFLMLYELAKIVPYHLAATAQDWLIAAAWPWIWFPIIHVIFELFQRTASVTFTPEHIVIRTRGRVIKLNRLVAHEWLAITHDKAEIEHDEGRSGPFRYYGRARILCVIHQGTRFDVLDIHDARVAQSFLLRCINADQYMESQLARGKGQALRAIDGYAKQAGGLKN